MYESVKSHKRNVPITKKKVFRLQDRREYICIYMKKIRNLLDIRRVNPFEAKFSVLYFESKKLLREKTRCI